MGLRPLLRRNLASNYWQTAEEKGAGIGASRAPARAPCRPRSDPHRRRRNGEPSEKQQALECAALGERAEIVVSMIKRMLEVLRLSHKIDAHVKGELTRATEKGISSGAEGGEASTWSLKACVDEVLAQRGYDAETTSEASRLTLSALAATVNLPGAKRFEAMSMAQQGKAAELVEEVAKALDEEGRSRLAKKALSGMGESES